MHTYYKERISIVNELTKMWIFFLKQSYFQLRRSFMH